jgi:hypothetical protein
MRWINYLLFFVPFAVFFTYAFLQMRKTGEKVKTPWFLLFTSGLLLAIAGFFGTWAMQPDNKGCEYVPSHMQDGKLVPGECRPHAGS